VGLGTDGAASNNDLDMFEAMRQAAFLHKLVASDPRAIPAPVRSRWRRSAAPARWAWTRRSARSSRAKRADLLIVSMSSARQTPMYDAVSHIVYVTRGDDVRTTIVNGKVLNAGPEGAHSRSASGAHRRRSLRRRRSAPPSSSPHGHNERPDFRSRHQAAHCRPGRGDRARLPEERRNHLVAILKGGFMFMADLVRAMSDRVTMDFMAVSSYGKGTTSSGQVRVLKDLDSNVEGRHVIVVEDIVDTGLTLHYLQDC
jgi:hypothetical protein